AWVALARLGAAVGFVGRVGNDAAGEEIRSGLAAEGGVASHVQVKREAASPQSLFLVDQPTGKRTICAYRRTASEIVIDNDNLDCLCSGRFLQLAGHSADAALIAAWAASARGVRVCLDAKAGA